jgi:hypothetical protein
MKKRRNKGVDEPASQLLKQKPKLVVAKDPRYRSRGHSQPEAERRYTLRYDVTTEENPKS